jgi:sulfatase modifying factor 1
MEPGVTTSMRAGGPPNASRRSWKFALAVLLVSTSAGGWISNRRGAASAAETAQRTDATVAASAERDCETCPEMLRVEPGSFTMGNPAAMDASFDGPAQPIVFQRPFRLGKFEVTRAEFAAFVEASGYQRPPDPQLPDRATDSWRRPGFEQTDRDPVVSVSSEDAQAYVDWLSKTTNKAYRLPSEAEWEFAARAGTQTNVYWGDAPVEEACRYANLADNDYRDAMLAAASDAGSGEAAGAVVAGITGPDNTFPCRDGHINTAPVGSFPANPWGFHDMLGNVSEWTLDCWNDRLLGMPPDGAPRLTGDCYRRALRGADFASDKTFLGVAKRGQVMMGDYGPWIGFRVARDE